VPKGVDHFAIQIARARGAVVTATCSEANRELAKSFGADAFELSVNGRP